MASCRLCHILCVEFKPLVQVVIRLGFCCGYVTEDVNIMESDSVYVDGLAEGKRIPLIMEIPPVGPVQHCGLHLIV